jgi:lipoxygenase homology domain-containing protein 1
MCKSVIVIVFAGQFRCFVWNDWIKAQKGKPLNLVTIPASSSPNADELYSIKVHTGDVRGAGTDSDISIILFGSDKQRSEELRLADSANNFERGRCDEFAVSLKAWCPHFCGLVSD